MSRLIVETGNAYGRLTVLERAGSSTYGEATWHCQCSCGAITTVIGSCLRRGITRSCGCYRRERITLPKGVAAFNQLLLQYKRGARERRFEWKLNKEEFARLTKQNCYYCDAAPSTVLDRPNVNGTYIYNGVDRIDNDEGYVLENCVPCCAICNRAKLDRDISEFLGWIEQVYLHTLTLCGGE